MTSVPWNEKQMSVWGFAVARDAIVLPKLSVLDGVILKDLPNLSVLDGVLESDTPSVGLSYIPASISFGEVNIGNSEVKSLRATNNNATPITIELVSTPVGVTADRTTNILVPSMSSVVINLTYTPTSEANLTGSITVSTDEGVTNTIAVSGKGKEVLEPSIIFPLRTLGNKIVYEHDTSEEVRLVSANWFGAEGSNFTPHGTWKRNWKEIILQIKGMGFNCIRLPFSGDTLGKSIGMYVIDYTVNPDLEGLNSTQILDLILDFCYDHNMFVVLDHHRRRQGDGADGSPVDQNYTLQDWINTWKAMATRYKSYPAVIGADVHNEPYQLDWDTWASYAEQCGNAIHTIAPKWCIFVEGVAGTNEDSYWWGGQLKGVRDRPVSLTVPNKLVYSPHEYGQSVSYQNWLAFEGQQAPENWPNNLYDVWYEFWSFIHYDNIAPIWIGEFGGFLGVDGNGLLTKPNSAQERQWLAELIKHLNGKKSATSTTNEGKMHFAYWSFNPNSSDTGGLLKDDWVSEQTIKLGLLKDLLSKD